MLPTLRFVIQRVSSGEVTIAEKSCGRMAKGLLVLVGIRHSPQTLVQATQTPAQALHAPLQASQTEINIDEVLAHMKPILEKAIDKLLSLRIFEDDAQKMNLSVTDVKGGVYLISQFTLFADVRKGNRPSFTNASKPALAEAVFESLVRLAKQKIVSTEVHIFTGKFAADMQVSLVNDGPVTIVFDINEAGIGSL